MLTKEEEQLCIPLEGIKKYSHSFIEMETMVWGLLLGCHLGSVMIWDATTGFATYGAMKPLRQSQAFHLLAIKRQM